MKKFENLPKKNVSDIDSSRERIKKQVVIIGGGPLTSLIVQLLGPFYNVTVITDQDTVGEPWRSRPLYINSTVKEKAGGKRLPLLTNGTTPITVSDQLGCVRLTNLLNTSDLAVQCDDGITRQYIAGQKLGAAVATNIMLGASDFIVEHTVDFRKTKVNSDGTKELTLVGKDGKVRKIDAGAVICLTGPGKEVCKVEKTKSQRAYEVSAKRVDDQIEKNRKFVKAGNLSRVQWDLPRILTLTSIEKLYGFWYKELKANPDPRYFPLTDVFRRDKRTGELKKVAIIGGADTAYTTSELFNYDGPPQSYPFELEKDETPLITHYNIPEQTPEEFAEAVRPRYKRVYSDRNRDRVTTNSNRVGSWRVLRGTGDNAKIVVTDVSEDGRESTQVFDYIIPATGLEKTKFEDLLAQSALSLQVVLDSEGQPSVKGDEANRFYIGGSASGLKVSDYPKDIQAIIRQLRIPENTISLWVNGLLVERFAWSFLLKNRVNASKVERIRS